MSEASHDISLLKTIRCYCVGMAPYIHVKLQQDTHISLQEKRGMRHALTFPKNFIIFTTVIVFLYALLMSRYSLIHEWLHAHAHPSTCTVVIHAHYRYIDRHTHTVHLQFK